MSGGSNLYAQKFATSAQDHAKKLAQAQQAAKGVGATSTSSTVQGSSGQFRASPTVSGESSSSFPLLESLITPVEAGRRQKPLGSLQQEAEAHVVEPESGEQKLRQLPERLPVESIEQEPVDDAEHQELEEDIFEDEDDEQVESFESLENAEAVAEEMAEGAEAQIAELREEITRLHEQEQDRSPGSPTIFRREVWR